MSFCSGEKNQSSDEVSMSFKSMMENGAHTGKRMCSSERSHVTQDYVTPIDSDSDFDRSMSIKYPIVNSILYLYPSAGIKQIALIFSNHQLFILSMIKEVTNPILIKRLSTEKIKARIKSYLHSADIVPSGDVIRDEFIDINKKQEYYALLLKYIRDYYSILSRSPDFKDYCYIGFFKDSKRNGRGIEITANGLNRGHFWNDLKEGYCEVHTTADEQVSGDYKQNTLNGVGQLHCSKFSMYGDFVQNDAQGISSIELHSGFISMGNFNKDKKDGYQCCIFLDGETYCGGIKHGNKNGLGVTSSQNVSEGVYQDDHLCNTVSISTADAINYIGDYKDGKPDGKGYIARGRGNTIYEGGLSKGVYDGMGQLIRLNKNSLSVEKGLFKDGRRLLG